MSFSSIIFETLSNYGRQLLFAIAPIPAYLPQYYTMCRSSNDPVLERKFHAYSSTSNTKAKTRKSRAFGSSHDFPAFVVDSCVLSTSTLTSTSCCAPLTSSTSPSSLPASTSATAAVVYGRTHQITEAGFSSTSIMILLLSHTFRLQYFLGSAIIYNLHIYYYHGSGSSSKANDDSEFGGTNVDRIHLDLVTQSLVMVGVQLLLLSAVTRRRRMATKRKVHDDDYDNDDDRYDHYDDRHIPYDFHQNGNHNDQSNHQLNQNVRFSWYSWTAIGKMIRKGTRTKKTTANTTTTTTTTMAAESSISQKPFVWLVHPRRYRRWDTVHQYVELIAVITVAMFVIGRYFLYPNDLLQYINTLKIISILLESCLALPQIILNYQRRSTEGLSLVMVLGWIVGDVLKMVYFIMSSGVLFHGHGSGGVNKFVQQGNDRIVQEESSSSFSSDMSTFIVGCIFALIMDVIVGLQVCNYYPSRDMLNLMEKLKKLWRRFEIQVLQIDVASTSNVVVKNHRKSHGGSVGGVGSLENIHADSMTCL
jgi:PQ loop repeat.